MTGREAKGEGGWGWGDGSEVQNENRNKAVPPPPPPTHTHQPPHPLSSLRLNVHAARRLAGLGGDFFSFSPAAAAATAARGPPVPGYRKNLHTLDM